VTDDIILALSRYDTLGASSRVRMFQYIPHLRARGLTVQAAPLLSNRYVESLYRGRRPALAGLAADYARRLVELLSGNRRRTLWVEKELLPWLPFPLERLLYCRGGRLVVDYDDAVWLQYAASSQAPVRALLGHKIERVMRRADVVAAGNAWLADHARAAGARRIELLPSVVDADHFPHARGHAPADTFTIGWIGSPSTAHYLRQAAAPLAALAARRRLRLLCIGIGKMELPGVNVQCLPWSEALEAADIARFDAGIMPLADGPWERGKCGYKLIQYMACGVPAVASAVGANLEIIEDGFNGLLVRDAADWERVLERLMDDAGLRDALGAAGRRCVLERYSVQAQLDHLISILTGAAHQ
jgi:glycosyltransferase involved in cell wall biosynthesis